LLQLLRLRLLHRLTLPRRLHRLVL
jgi:hypothetical protein